MHKFLRSAGFSEYNSESMVYRLIRKVVERPEHLSARLDFGDGGVLLEYRMPINASIGICAAIYYCGAEFSEIQYYYPYYDNYELTSDAVCTIERHTAAETYSGVIDEYNIGLSLIFFISNPLSYRTRPDAAEVREFRGTSLSAFSNEATILLPVISQKEFSGNAAQQFEDEKLYEAAANGDISAIETLTQSDLNMYNQISERIENEDLYSLVEQSFMPCGVECDQYSIIGEIIDMTESMNEYTNEELWQLKISSNDVEFWMCIRKGDLLGEPMIGRRIKCKLWMQGKVNLEF